MSEDPRSPNDLLATKLGRFIGSLVGRADTFIDSFLVALRDEYDRHVTGLVYRFVVRSPVVMREEPPKPVVVREPKPFVVMKEPAWRQYVDWVKVPEPDPRRSQT
jgi:hypothetical protein